jgi:hypothetical protein
MEMTVMHLATAFVGGLVGTTAMDIAKYVGHAMRLIGGVRMDMLGRWALGMVGGRFVYDDIHEAVSYPNEVPVGWFFHYATGGLVALAYPFLLPVLGMPPVADPVMSGMLFGLGTSILPWFIVYPAFGKGWFGNRAPKGARPVITSLVSHTFYGAGIGLVYRFAI